MDNNTSCNTVENFSQFPNEVPIKLDLVYALFEILCSILSIVGNSVVLYVYIRHRSLRAQAKNTYVASLAAADLLVGLVGIPSALSTSVGLPHHFEGCLVMNSILIMLCTASIMSLLAVTVDRLLAIRYPFKYTKNITPSRAIALSWVIATVVGLLPLLRWNKGIPPVPRCFFVEVIEGRYLVFICFITIVVPSTVMAVMYTSIYRSVTSQGLEMRAFRASGEIVGQSDMIKRQQQLTIESRTAKSIAVIVIIFIVSWLPINALNTIAEFCPSCHIPHEAFLSAIVLSHYNSVWNPLLYAWGMKDIRKAFKQILVTPTERRLQHMCMNHFTSDKRKLSESTVKKDEVTELNKDGSRFYVNSV